LPPQSRFVIAFEKLVAGAGLVNDATGDARFGSMLSTIEGLKPGDLIDVRVETSTGMEANDLVACVAFYLFPYAEGLCHHGMPVVSAPRWSNRVWMLVAKVLPVDNKLGPLSVVSLSLLERIRFEKPMWVAGAVREACREAQSHVALWCQEASRLHSPPPVPMNPQVQVRRD
jgi:hypothetical protein